MAPHKWNPRYVQYASAHGRSPTDMQKYDRERMPGGPMADFMLWMGKRWAEFSEETGVNRHDPKDTGFDIWLTAKVEKEKS